MSVEFTHVPSGNSYPWQYLSSGRDARALRPVLASVFGTIVIDGPAGILTNMDIAAEAARTTSIPGIALTHWSGVIDPVVASRQIAALDRVADGRLSLRFLFGPDGHAGEEAEQIDHAEALRQTDEYLVLLKRLWSNDLPFDHEGPNYSVSGGFVERKGPQGADIPIRMGGVAATPSAAATNAGAAIAEADSATQLCSSVLMRSPRLCLYMRITMRSSGWISWASRAASTLAASS